MGDLPKGSISETELILASPKCGDHRLGVAERSPQGTRVPPRKTAEAKGHTGREL